MRVTSDGGGLALQGPGRLVDQVLQQLQDVGLNAGKLGVRSRHGSPASSPRCREALQPSSAANQGEPDLKGPVEQTGRSTLDEPFSFIINQCGGLGSQVCVFDMWLQITHMSWTGLKKTP